MKRWRNIIIKLYFEVPFILTYSLLWLIFSKVLWTKYSFYSLLWSFLYFASFICQGYRLIFPESLWSGLFDFNWKRTFLKGPLLRTKLRLSRPPLRVRGREEWEKFRDIFRLQIWRKARAETRIKLQRLEMPIKPSP